MTRKSKPEPTLDEAKARLDAYFEKQRRQSPDSSPKWEDEPAGVIHGNPDTLDDEFNDDDHRPDLKVIRSPKKSNQDD